MKTPKQYTIRRISGHVLAQSNMSDLIPRWYEGHQPPPYAYGDNSLGTDHLSLSILLDAFGDNAQGCEYVFASKVLSKVTIDEWTISDGMIQEFFAYLAQSHIAFSARVGILHAAVGKYAELPARPVWLSEPNASLRLNQIR